MPGPTPGGGWGPWLVRYLEDVFLRDPVVREFASMASVSVLPVFRDGLGSYCAMLGFVYGDASIEVRRPGSRLVRVKVSTPKATTLFAGAWHLLGYSVSWHWFCDYSCRPGTCMVFRASVPREVVGVYSDYVEGARKQLVLEAIAEVCLDSPEGLAGLVAGLIDSEGSVSKRCRMVEIVMGDGYLLGMVRERLEHLTGGRGVREYKPPKRGMARLALTGELPGWFWRRVLRYVAHPSRRLRMLKMAVNSDPRSAAYRRLVKYAYAVADAMDTSVCREDCKTVAGAVVDMVAKLSSHGPQAAQAAAPAPPLIHAMLLLPLPPPVAAA